MPHAIGSFTVKVQPLTQPMPPGLARFSIDKQVQGDLSGLTQGEMLSGGNPKAGAAGYVAIELFTGTLHGKRGSFALQHSATMSGAGQNMSIIVVPGSGSEELQGIDGAFVIQIADGLHSYTFDYTLPG